MKTIWKSIKVLFKILFLALTFLGSGHLLKAQIVPVSHILPDGAISQNYDGTVDFDLPGVDPDFITWSWTADVITSTSTTSLDATGITTNIGLSLDTETGEVTGTFLASTAGILVRFTVSASVSGAADPDPKEYILIIRSSFLPDCDNFKFSLVLDASGSMGSGTPTGTRWTDLQTAVRSYLPSLNNWVNPTVDSLQVVFFQGSAASETFNGRFSDIDWRSLSDINTNIFGTTSPGGLTPLGAGLNLSDLPTTNDDRSIILLTDGYQNVSPMYTAADHSVGGIPIDGGINIFSIGVSGGDPDLIDDIARPNDGSASAFTFNPLELDTLFQITIPELFNDCSPRIVDYRAGRMQGRAVSIQERFQVDSLVRKISVLLKVKSAAREAVIERGFQLSKDGIPITGFDYFDAKELRYVFDLPLILDDKSTDAMDGGGEWMLEFSGTNGTPYELVVMVDDKYIDTEMEIGNGGNVYAGDDIRVEATAEVVGQPLDGLNVRAIMLRPGEDPGRLFSEASYDQNPTFPEGQAAPGLSSSSLAAQEKIRFLLSDPDFLARLAKEQRIITLSNPGDGRYTGTFPGSETEVSSFYKVLVAFEGPVNGFGIFNGIELDYFEVEFSRPEDVRLNLNTTLSPGGGLDGNSLTYRVKPTNKFGNPIGPARAQQIQVVINGQQRVLEDNLDGTYSGSVNISPGSRPRFEAYVDDLSTPVVNRRIGPFVGISGHLGVLYPLNTNTPFDTLSNGIYYGADISFHLSRYWDLEILGNLNRFDSNYDIWDISLYASYSFVNNPIAGFTPQLKLGAGYYKPDALDGKPGLGARIGFSRYLGANIEWGAEIGASYILDHELLFGKGGVFVKWLF